jgi:hypothetical protein
MTIDIDRLAKTLRMQRANLAALLEHPERDSNDFHLALAGVMRSMLCDKDCPTVIKFANQLCIDLRCWGPFPPYEKNNDPPTFAFDALVASPDPVWGAYEMSVSDYLDAPIGAAPVSPSDEFLPRSKWYTPRELITRAANKEGPAHFQPKPYAPLVQFGSAFVVNGSVTMIDENGLETPVTENDNITLRIALLQIAQLTVSLSDQLLAQYSHEKSDLINSVKSSQ